MPQVITSGLTKWNGRARTLDAAILLLLARLAVRILPLRYLRFWLGALTSVQAANPAQALPAGQLSHARALARRVERAAQRLPGESRCLPRAMALHRLLARSGIASLLVIAIHRADRAGPQAFHAWVEHGGEMLVGQCDRADYGAVMTFALPRPAPGATR